MQAGQHGAHVAEVLERGEAVGLLGIVVWGAEGGGGDVVVVVEEGDVDGGGAVEDGVGVAVGGCGVVVSTCRLAGGLGERIEDGRYGTYR